MHVCACGAFDDGLGEYDVRAGASRPSVPQTDTDFVSTSIVRRVELPSGLLTTLAGQRNVPLGQADGVGSNALFYWCYAVAMDAAGAVALVVSSSPCEGSGDGGAVSVGFCAFR